MEDALIYGYRLLVAGSWPHLARYLKAEKGPERIEAYGGTVSLPFEGLTGAWPSRSRTTTASRA